MGANRHLIKCAVVGSLGGFLFGFDMAVIAGTTTGLTRTFGLSPRGLGFTIAIALCGTVLGAMTAGALESRSGARDVLRVLALFYVFSAAGCMLAPTWTSLLVSRFIGGIAIGGSSVLGPVYIAELSPAPMRGRLVGLFQINIVVGATFAYISNYLLAKAQLGVAEWRVDFGVAGVPALLFFILLFTIPRSARWLVTKGRMAEARTALQMSGSADPMGELDEIAASIEQCGSESAEALFQWQYRKPIFLGVSLAVFNQLSGVNVVSYYLNDIFRYAGFSQLSAGLQAVFVGLVNLIATLIAMFLIDRLGRRFLLLIGSVGMTITLVGVTLIFMLRSHAGWLLPILAAYIGFFAVSQGAVIWVYLSEIFPNRVRGKGQGLGATTTWVLNAVICGVFPVIAHYSPAYPFGFFAVMMALQFFAVWFFFPETKGKSLEQLQRQFGIGILKNTVESDRVSASVHVPLK